jgi:phosphopantothenoylcysteine decarboxylase/phosphopantothenate--cysteine ligase
VCTWRATPRRRKVMRQISGNRPPHRAGPVGGIACYKSAELVRELTQAGATVQVVMTEAACQFITPVTMQALSGRAVYTEPVGCARAQQHGAHQPGRGADAILVAPASADFIAQLAQGRADDCWPCCAWPGPSPLSAAAGPGDEPRDVGATRPRSATRAGGGRRRHPAGPGSGSQACGETGDGRMLEAEELRDELIAFFQPKLLAGRRRC